jgi:hypothetical protein
VPFRSTASRIGNPAKSGLRQVRLIRLSEVAETAPFFMSRVRIACGFDPISTSRIFDDSMVGNTQRVFMRPAIIVATAVMLLVAIYRAIWLFLGILSSGVGPISSSDMAWILQVPAYFVSALTAWKWPWIAELVAVIVLAVIFMRFKPWTVSPFQRGLSCDYAFIVAANVVFFVKVLSRRLENKTI